MDKEVQEYKEQVKDLMKMEDPAMDMILSSTYLPQKFETIGTMELAEIRADLPVLHRNMNVYGRTNSQVKGKLMTLQMLKCGPFDAIRQCDAQINAKKGALKEAGFKRLKEMNKINRVESILSLGYFYNEYGTKMEVDEFKERDFQIELVEARCGLADSISIIEHALKEYLMYIRTRKEIMEAHNIPENFNEEDFNEGELKEHIQTMFQHALRDIQVTGNANHGTCEYFEQFGINPTIGYAEARKYISGLLNPENEPDIDTLYKWYDEMYEKYKDAPKKAMKRLGIENLITDDVAFIEDK